MALARARRGDRRIDYWPGFVDALSTLLLAIMFLLSVFVLAQFLLSREISGKDEVLNRLNSQINELTQLLALEKTNTQDAQDQLANPAGLAEAAETERSRLQQLLDRGAGAGAEAEQIGTLSGELNSQRQISQQALSQVELLNQQIAALRKQIGALETSLDASEIARPRIQHQDRGSRPAAQCGACPARAGTQPLPVRLSSGGCAKSCRTAKTSASSATASCSSRKCCSRSAPMRSTMRAASKWRSWRRR